MGSSAKITAGRPINRASDGYPLLLAAGKLGRPVAEPVGDPHRHNELVEPIAVDALVGEGERQEDVLFCVEDRQEVERLENKADLVPAQPREVAFVERAQVSAVHGHSPGRGPVEAGQEVEQRRFARTRRAHDGGKPPGAKRDVNSVEGRDSGLARTVTPAQFVGYDDRGVRERGLGNSARD